MGTIHHAIPISGRGKNIIVGEPSESHKVEKTFVTAGNSNSKVTDVETWGDFALTARLTVSATTSGASISPHLYVDTVDYYDLTNYDKLCVALGTKWTSHTGHRQYVKLIAEDGTVTTLQTITSGSASDYKLAKSALDISSYTGKYKIRVETATGNATYGYSAQYTEFCLMFLGLY